MEIREPIGIIIMLVLGLIQDTKWVITRLPLTLVELKKLIADCAVDSTGDDSAGVFTAEALAGASSASTGKGVLDALDLPPPEEALDVL